MQPNTANPGAVYSQANTVYNQGLQGGNQAQAQYQGDIGQYQNAQANLQNYQQNMPNLSNIYNQSVSTDEGQYGLNPQQIQAANQALASTQSTMNELPQAIQQSANGRGLTAAQEANRFMGAANNMQTTLGNQTAGVNALQQSIQNALSQAGQSTSFEGQTQQMQLGALQNLATNALSQEQTALQAVNYYRGLESQGVQLTEGEQNALANAEAAAAQAESAAASMLSAQNQGKLINAQLSGLNGSNYNSNALGQQRQPTVVPPGQESNLMAFLQNLENPANRTLNIGSFLSGVGGGLSGLLGQLGL